ncbi:DUF2804 domain-containing protein [Paraoerskovia marina]|uniref:DUF2804 domain-containing protein n=1 Tax=Paraoerskovia marina TaxID=545619 RepID=UPI000492750E|nr:DUF2804 domain-containing protein [Paraoerskovia marina]
MVERELTQTVPLTLPNGRLNREAVGWARTASVTTEGIGGLRSWGRNKRWEYWNVVTPRFILAATVSSLDYAGVHEVWVFDRHSKTSVAASTTAILAAGTELPGSLGKGPVRAWSRALAIAVDEVDGGTRIRARIEGASFDVVAARPSGHGALGVVVPWSDRRFQYTVKDVARPATGTVTVGDETQELTPGESWAVLDHGRGRWPYDMRWNWGAGSGVCDGRRIGLQVGGRWTVGTGSTENAVFVDGRLHKIGEELTWDYDPADYLAPWRVHGAGLDATLVPEHDKVSRTNLGLLSSRTDQCFGTWSGTFETGSGERIDFTGLVGWAEDVHNRW